MIIVSEDKVSLLYKYKRVQFEKTISLYDLQVILGSLLVLPHRITIKKFGDDPIESCTVIDVNKKSETITFIFKNQNAPTMQKIPIGSIELIEFDFFYTYKGIAAKTFILE